TNGVFVGIFGQNFFASTEFKYIAANFHGLIDFTDQIKFDASFGWVVGRVMLPVREIEITAEFAIDPREQVFVELRGHAGAVVVSRLENMSIFLEIDSDEQAAVLAGEVGQSRQKLAGTIRLEISNGRSRKINDAARRKFSRQRQFERLEIISRHGQDLKRRKHFLKTRARFFELLFGTLDRHVNVRLAQFFEQDPRLSSRPGAETD